MNDTTVVYATAAIETTDPFANRAVTGLDMYVALRRFPILFLTMRV